MSETTIFKNGKIYTLDPQYPLVEALVVRDGKILDLGSTSDILLQWGDATGQQIDLEGDMATPGLIDSHAHLSALGLKLLSLDLTGVSSKRDMLAAIREEAENTPTGNWLIGRGWDENLFSNGLPSIEELDEAASKCPIFLSRVCGHAFLVNSKAFEVCGVDANTRPPSGGEIVLDSSTGQPTGLILETASQLFQVHIPKNDYGKLKEAVKSSMDLALSQGITSIHTEDLRYLDGFANTYKIYQELISEEGYKIRCNLLIYHPFLPDLLKEGMATGFGDEFLKIGAIKVFVDGALGRRTAKLSHPYTDSPQENGQLVMDEAQLKEVVKQARKHKMPIASHVIGDQALKIMLDVLDQFDSAPYPDRLIHAQILNPELIQRLNHPSRIADIQPHFLVSDFPWVMDRLGAERASASYAWKTMLKAGIRCAGGSDAPVEPLNPLLGIQAAVTRKGLLDNHEGWNPKEKLTIQEAIELFTIGGAYATGEEEVKGSLTRGKYADMTVFSKDLFEVPDKEIANVKVRKTIIGGDICYESSD